MKSLIYIFLLFLSSGVLSQSSANIVLSFFIDENAENGTLVGAVSASDPDGDPLTFVITSGNEEEGFVLNGETGDITVNNQEVLDFEVTPRFELSLEADDGKGGVAKANITINLNDVNEIVLSAERVNDRIVLYPNPVRASLFIDFPQIQKDDLEVLLYSIGGQEIPTNQEFISESKRKISFQKLESGIYFLSIPSLKYREKIYSN